MIEQTFQKYFGNCDGMVTSIAPGRVNLIGEYTDYNQGFVLPTTIDKAIYLAVRKRLDHTCILHSLNFKASTTFTLDHLIKDNANPWANYIKGVLQVLQNAGHQFRGIEGTIYGDIPIGAGLSSSAALEIATINALQHLFDLPLSPLTMIQLAQQAENTFVGMRCGIMDQFVSLLGRQNCALFIDCLNLQHSLVPLNLAQHCLLIINSKIKHELVSSAYNERREQCEEGVKYFHALDHNITSLRQVSPQLFANHRTKLNPVIERRCQHIITENTRVLQAVASLRASNMEQLGQLFYASHLSLKNDYETSCKEIDLIVDTAQEHGALGARITGGGFGGCAIVLTTKDLAITLANTISEKYQQKIGFYPEIMKLDKNLEAKIV